VARSFKRELLHVRMNLRRKPWGIGSEETSWIARGFEAASEIHEDATELHTRL
jgi:hypothetical protein